MTVRTFARRALMLVAIVMAAAPVGTQAPRYDLLIRNGRIVDGTGNPWFQGDVGVRGDRIVTVGTLAGATATRVLDARGLVVAPGFIDLHTHSDLVLVGDGTAQSKIRQGVTLDIMGEGSSVAPRDGLPGETVDGVTVDWRTFTEYFARLEHQGISMNVISHVASDQIRRVVMGYAARPATPAELDKMRALMARSMEEGAWGLVTRYESGGPAHPDEEIALARIGASYGGNYTSHIGSEGFEQEKELAFVFRVAEEAHIPAHIFHLKIRSRENWGTVGRYLAMIEAARARGLDVTANQYPYTAMFHGWNAFFPVWAREGGPAAFAERLLEPSVRARIKADPGFDTWAREHGGWDGIVMARASKPALKEYEGKSIAQIAKLRGDADPADTCLALMAEDGGRISGIFHTMSEEDVRTVMRQPWVAVASDGSALNLDAPGVPHPRNYSTNVRVLGHYVRDEHVLALEDAIRKMTSLPAQILGLADRGQVREGFAADLVVLDPARVRETNSFEKPKSYAEGPRYVIVNGVVVIDEGQHTGARPGRALRGKGFRTKPGPSAP